MIVPTVIVTFAMNVMVENQSRKQLEISAFDSGNILRNFINAELTDLSAFTDMLAANTDIHNLGAELGRSHSYLPIDHYNLHVLNTAIRSVMSIKLEAKPHITNFKIYYEDHGFIFDYRYGINPYERMRWFFPLEVIEPFVNERVYRFYERGGTQMIEFYNGYTAFRSRSEIGVSAIMDANMLYSYLLRNMMESGYDFVLIELETRDVVMGDGGKYNDIPELQRYVNERIETSRDRHTGEIPDTVYIGGDLSISLFQPPVDDILLVVYRDITDKNILYRNVQWVLGVLLGSLLLMFIAVSAFSAKRLSSPLKKLVKELGLGMAGTKDELSLLHRRIYEIIDEQKQTESLYKQLAADIKNKEPLLKEYLIFTLFNGDEAHEFRYKNLEEYGIRFTHESSVVIIVKYYRNDQAVNANHEMFAHVRDGFCEGALPGECVAGCIKNNALAFVYNFEPSMTMEGVRRRTMGIIKESSDGSDFFISASDVAMQTKLDADGLSVMYEQAKNRGRQVYTKGYNVFCDSEADAAEAFYPEKHESEFLKGVYEKDIVAADAAIGRFVAALVSENADSYEYVRLGVNKLTLALSMYVANNGASYSGQRRDAAYYFNLYINEIESHVTINQFASWLSHTARTMILGQDIEDKNSQNLSAQTIIYLEKNYKQPISLDILSELFQKSPSHISRAIKNEFGQNFIDILTHIRIIKAKELLSTSNMTVAEVGREVGYEYDHYFIKRFKEIEHITPKQYRERQMSGGEKKIG